VRLRLTGAVVIAAAALLLTGCGKPPGTDGNLTNNWAALPEAKIPVPVAKVCYQIESDNPSTVTKWPASVECARTHTVETIHVGTFGGDDATRSSPPPTGGPGRRKAYEECASQAKTFLGDDWRAGRLDLFLVTPVTLHWEGGARWFRCDLVEYKDLDNYEIVSRTASLQGGLGSSRELGLGCFRATEKGGSIDTMVATDCNAAHNSEFTGVYVAADGTYPADSAARGRQDLEGCKPITAGFTGVPNDSNLQFRVGQITFPFGKEDWELGNRGVRCYLWITSRALTKSGKGAGTAGFPINFK
jgi:hypothetical protein